MWKSESTARLGAGAEPGGGLKAGVYPNPIEAEFTVVIEGAQDQVVSLVVTDLNGRSLLTKQVAVSQEFIRNGWDWAMPLVDYICCGLARPRKARPLS